MGLSEDIELFTKKTQTLEESMNSSGNVVSLFGISFYDGMDFTYLNNDNLNLAHVVLHKNYHDKYPKIPKNWLKSMHSSLLIELEKRGIMHKNYDNLDKNDGL